MKKLFIITILILLAGCTQTKPVEQIVQEQPEQEKPQRIIGSEELGTVAIIIPKTNAIKHIYVEGENYMPKDLNIDLSVVTTQLVLKENGIQYEYRNPDGSLIWAENGQEDVFKFILDLQSQINDLSARITNLEKLIK